MTETRMPLVIDALVDTWSGLDGVTAWDGPPLTGDFDVAVCVGYDNDPDGVFEAATAAQDWAGIGQRKRDEVVSVTCSIIAHSPDDTPKGARDACFAVLEQCGASLRADPSLGLSPPCVAGLSPNAFYQLPEETGMWGRLTFTVYVQTRV